MNARKLALSLAAASAFAVALPTSAQDVVIVAPAPQPVYPAPLPGSAVVVTTPEGAVVRQYHYLDDTNRRLDGIGGMTAHERNNAAGQQDYVTGVITAPGYMGPRDAKGQ